MHYTITFQDVWTALRFAQLYEDHLYKDKACADIMLYQDGHLIGADPRQKYFKIKKTGCRSHRAL